MIEYKETEVTEDDVIIPPILFKYRDWKDKNHKRVICHQELFMSPVSWFEVEKDSRMFRRYDYTDDEMFDMCFNRLQRDSSSYSRLELQYQAIVWCQNSPMQDKEFIENF